MKSKSIRPAAVGQKIEWLNESFNVMIRGIVLNQYENSVCVIILDYTEKHQEMYESERTIVNHKRYTILD